MDSVCRNGLASGKNLVRINPETKSREQGAWYLEVMALPNSCIILDNWSRPLWALVFHLKIRGYFPWWVMNLERYWEKKLCKLWGNKKVSFSLNAEFQWPDSAAGLVGWVSRICTLEQSLSEWRSGLTSGSTKGFDYTLALISEKNFSRTDSRQ